MWYTVHEEEAAMASDSSSSSRGRRNSAEISLLERNSSSTMEAGDGGGGKAGFVAEAESPEDDLRHSIWIMHRRKVAGNLILSSALLLALTVIAIVNVKDAKLFSFGWSNRVVNVGGTKDAIVSMYRDNRDTSDAKLADMLDRSMDLAMCTEVSFHGGSVLKWKREEASPTCNCLRNVHYEYVRSVTPNGVHLDDTVMNRPDSKLNCLWISNRVRVECFQNIRHTQVEDISDPVTDSTTHAFTNIVSTVIYWNVVGCITSAFVFYFDVMSYEPNKNSSSPFSRRPNREESPVYIFFGIFLFVWVVFPLVIPFFICGTVHSTIMFLVAFFFFFFAAFMHGSGHMKDSIDKNNSRYPARKKIVYWVGYIITVPALVMSCNMLMQRRDTLFNFTTAFMTVCIGLCSLGSEMVYTAYEHFYISHYTKKRDEMDKLQYEVDSAVLNFREQKNAMVKISLFVILILVVGISCTSFPIFASTPFSNAYHAIFVVLPMMLVIPPLVTGRIIGLVPTAEDANDSNSSGNAKRMEAFSSGTSGQTWVLELITIELLARAFFTVPVMYDLYSVGVTDNKVVSLPHQFFF